MRFFFFFVLYIQSINIIELFFYVVDIKMVVATRGWGLKKEMIGLYEKKNHKIEENLRFKTKSNWESNRLSCN